MKNFIEETVDKLQTLAVESDRTAVENILIDRLAELVNSVDIRFQYFGDCTLRKINFVAKNITDIELLPKEQLVVGYVNNVLTNFVPATEKNATKYYEDCIERKIIFDKIFDKYPDAAICVNERDEKAYPVMDAEIQNAINCLRELSLEYKERYLILLNKADKVFTFSDAADQLLKEYEAQCYEYVYTRRFLNPDVALYLQKSYKLVASLAVVYAAILSPYNTCIKKCFVKDAIEHVQKCFGTVYHATAAKVAK